ncbi:MAG: hypothetical protein A2163_06720 [Actinobacteria bacterium RBG_13_35_12]|jgi:TrpR-related protein YerC/YecD|nr:MAG: hypothetical protein A2163_06720 [Actinobacteria bacterium RBG_13_35_12]
MQSIKAKEERKQEIKDAILNKNFVIPEKIILDKKILDKIFQVDILEEIAHKTNVSSATISRIKRCLNYGTDGYKLILGRLFEKKK